MYWDFKACRDAKKTPPEPCGGGLDDTIFIGKGRCDSAYTTAVGRMLATDTIWCPALRENWYNFGTNITIDKSLWNHDEPSYCGVGPIPFAAALTTTDYSDGDPSASLTAVNGGTLLPGAVYQCCKEYITCFDDGTNTTNITNACPSR
jgi:hypothetical protein